MKPAHKDFTEKFLNYLNSTGSPYHTVNEMVEVLEKSGFVRYNGDLKKDGKYYLTFNYSTLLAFHIGPDFDLNNQRSTAVIAGAHTDSPCLRIRPNSITHNEGFTQLSVSTYGGGLWHTWFDRGLGVAGKVVTTNCREKLIRIQEPICIIPNLAIHLQLGDEHKSFTFDKESHLQPIISCTAHDSSLEDQSNFKQVCTLPKELLNKICDQTELQPNEVLSYDLCLMDSVPSRFAGINEEFIDSPRLDNLGGTYSCFYGLILASENNKHDIIMVASFDHEEVGSKSYTGSQSDILRQILTELLSKLAEVETFSFQHFMYRSMFLSVDMAHGVHPNYPERHQRDHKPVFKGGIVLKHNFNQSYSTDCTTASYIKAIAQKANIPLQEFLVKNNSPCGGTIGPIVACKLGVRTADIGVPMLAMHSIREFMAADDIYILMDFIKSYFELWGEFKGQSLLLDDLHI
ncbi:aspartyl aminopeptidase protein, putative [Cryptosporidium muris RN66]|uniref:aspartyl aminopeptidase n=1 Tax=Cryptosporidium muris (strain RN66) TaxID=441375 RepID=B6AIS8_CRYMR|nr:aspartyl aminopeptidase protein, putative [Cryptosporidium muris RN66]EEA08119.1 aspartyl aminopeptidase protein, putative [Cryptosporidium muris RN66]|eukprot:XP_002142468.1 aspartyl aminopeptidase protein [Cryptosporidium muris RN66]